MDFFDFSKQFNRVFVERGEVDGAIEGDNCRLTEQLKKRTELGRAYAENYIDDDESETAETETIFSPGDKMSSVDDLECTTAGGMPNINELKSEKVHHIYKEYYENNPAPHTNLIINEYKKKILSLVETNEVTILTGQTGCGKTTQVPQFILDSHIEKNRYCNIVVTQPRRIAAINIAARVCEERKWELGTLCGYKVGLKNCTSNDTLLTYMTTGVLLQTLITKKNMHSFTHIVLDEIHERNQSMDFLLIIVKKLLNKFGHNVKVILMSATVEAMKFANYFQKICRGDTQYAPVITIGQKSNYTVQIHYLEELAALGELPEISDSYPQISDLNFDICIRLIKQFEKIDNEENVKHSVLVFLPGIYEIDYLYTKLTDPKIYSACSVNYKWAPLPLHSSITVEEQAQAFLPPPNGYRKIILATNVAESSITVPGVKFVIDFCLTKYLKTESSNFSSLQLCWASQANCIQRAGRVGRVMHGRVYRMVYKDFYNNLEKESTPEMLIAPLEKVVLQAKMLDMGEPKKILAMALDPPDLSNIELTILILKEVGGLLRTRRGTATPFDGDITYLGRLMAILPVDIRITRLIIMGHLFSCLEECIIMGACMSLKSIFNHPFKTKLKSYNSKLDWADGSCSDCIAYLNVYEIWCNNHRNGYFKRSAGDNEKNWAKRHFIQLRLLKEVKLLVEELKSRLKENLIEEPIGPGRVQWNEFQKALILKMAIGGAFYPNYFGRGTMRGLIKEKVAVKTVGGRNPFTTVYLNNFPVEQPLELYSQLIKSELEDCNEDMRVTYDGSNKVYVEFRKSDLMQRSGRDMPFDGTLPGKIPMGVYRAVKMRQIKKSISIKLLPIHLAEKRAKSLGIKSRLEYLKDQSSSRPTQSTTTRLPGLNVSCVQLVLSYIIDPGHFWAYDTRDFETQKMLFTALNDPSQELMTLIREPVVGEICIAPYPEGAESYLYRARVLNVKNERVQVLFIDYGNSAVVNKLDLRQYSPKLIKTFGNVPSLAFECVLCELQPSVIMNPTGKWSEKSRDDFHELIKGSHFSASIYSVVNGVVSLELFKVMEGNKQISINKYLIDKEYAEKSEENYLSQRNHALRTQQLENQKGSVLDSENENFWNDKFIDPPAPDDCTITANLRGPYSPLEMKLYPYIRGALDKLIRINDDSVNSVILDTNPQDRHERLVVAGGINQNAEGSVLILHNTTIMPNIHGLSAIIPLIFAPEIELRVNKARTHYTGMLCGLGPDDNGDSLFPEHDFEVFFDCEITNEDITIVNSLRHFMSLMLLTEGGKQTPDLSYPDLIKYQNKIKYSLLRLLSDKRQSMNFEGSNSEYKWKTVKSDLAIDNPIANRFNEISIFRFHRTVSIQSANS